VTEARAADKQAVEAVREIVRRAGHELRNALSGVAVNVEVVRSRSERKAPVTELTSFAERARLQVGVSSALADGLLALVSSVLTAVADGTLRSAAGHGGGNQTELMIYGDRAAAVVSDIERLASLVGVSVEHRGERVILNVLPEGKSHSKD
jgi:alkanesulfonate monooxygenase SsuD/methylene tetrahydromethanopterin reductase-like flavin-dependent oxidoreductase (luciferase family)